MGLSFLFCPERKISSITPRQRMAFQLEGLKENPIFQGFKDLSI